MTTPTIIMPQAGGQTKFLSQLFVDEVLFGGAAGPGKIVCDNAVVLSPFGWLKGKDLEVGTTICNPDGSHQKIIQVHPRIKHPGWVVTFNDDSSTTVMEGHLWLAWRSGKRSKTINESNFGENSAKIVTTKTLKEWHEKAEQQNKIGQRPNWACIPVCKEQHFNKTFRTPILIKPYLLGLLLGDGSLSGKDLTITCHVDDAGEYSDYLAHNNIGYSVYGKSDIKSINIRNYVTSGYKAELKALDLLGTKSHNKFIPDKYLYSSIENRYELLKGLLDTDGTIDKKGYIGFTTISKKLAYDVKELISSLGGTAKITSRIPKYDNGKKEGQRAYSLYIKHNQPEKLFNLSRKKKLVENCAIKPMYKRVVSVEVVGNVEGRCITVDNPNGLYITDDYIVTHNSWALIFDALGTQYIHTPLGKPAYQIPDYRAVLFRRKTTQFSKLLDEGKKMYVPLGAELVYKRSGDPGPSFNFKSGARIFICHMEQEDNKEDHQGIEYQYSGFDELTQFTVTQYIYLFSRLRSTIPYLNARMRSTTNPTGSGLIWAKKRFVKTADVLFVPNKVYYFAPDAQNSIEDNPTGILTTKDNKFAKSRMFVPGTLNDNKILLNADPNYALNIMAMGKKYENALLHGDWDAFGGDFFDDFDSQKSKKTPFEIPGEWNIYGSVDPGWSNPCAFGLHAVDFNGNVYTLFTSSIKGNSPSENAREVKEKIKNFRYTNGRMPSMIFSGKDAFAKKDLNAILSSDATFADKWAEEGLVLTPAYTDRINGWMQVKQYMRFNKWFYFDGFCEPLIEEIVAAPTGEKDPDDIEGKGNDAKISDHSIDMLRYFMTSKFVPIEIPDKPLPSWYYEDFERDLEGAAPSVMSI